MAYKIRDTRFEEFTGRIAKLQKRAKRLGVAGPVVVEHGTEEIPLVRNEKSGNLVERAITDLRGAAVVGWAKYHIVEVTGEAPKFNGWEFVATVEAIGGELNLVSAVPTAGEFDVERFVRGNAQECDHCNLNRRRNSVFVVRHDDGTLKQVGSNCLADFLGHEDPSKIAAQCELLLRAIEIAEAGEEFEAGSAPTVLDLVNYLARVKAHIKQDGWLSRGKARETGSGYATADAAVDSTFGTGIYNKFPEEIPPVTAEDKAFAKDAVAWAASLDPHFDNSFEWAIKAISEAEVVAIKRVGFAAAIVGAFSRFLEQQLDLTERAGTSEYVGVPKKRQVFASLKVTRLREIEGNYGVTYIHGFKDENGNEFVWFASRHQGLEVGQEINLKATVKAHNEYQGVKQTTITRGVVVE